MTITYERIAEAEKLSDAMESFILSMEMALDDVKGIADLESACADLIEDANRRKAEADKTLAEAERAEARELNRWYERSAI